MLPVQHRMRTSAQFSATVRSGARSGRRNVVVSVRVSDQDQPTRVGFVVSKAVGNAVVRNKVKRRLREFAADTVRSRPTGHDVVIRALPASAGATWNELGDDYRGAYASASRKAGQRQTSAMPSAMPYRSKCKVLEEAHTWKTGWQPTLS